MNKSVKTLLLVLGIAAIWIALASVDAGLLGFGVILAIVALLDVVRGEFSANNKVIWLTTNLAALLFALLGLGAAALLPSAEQQGGNPIRVVSTVVVLVLPLAYFLFGRKQKVGNPGRAAR